MKNKKILLGLALSVVLSACQISPTSQNAVTDKTINDALDDQKANDENLQKKEVKEKPTQTKDKNAIDLNHWRKMIVDIGDFSKTVANNIKDEELTELIKDAKKTSEETGYRDSKDFVFQELGKRYPELSNKFPLDSVERKYERVKSEVGENTGKFEYQRRALIDYGYDSDEVRALSDKEIEDAFKEAYEEDDSQYFEDYLKKAGEILFGEEESKPDETSSDEEDDEEKSSDSRDTKSSKAKENMRYGSSQTDYDALKSSLVQFYEFSPATVNLMTNEDIDIAYNKAMNEIKESGSGDFSLVIEELGYMYPGASKMYPGVEADDERNE